jgi:hypothetical protein
VVIAVYSQVLLVQPASTQMEVVRIVTIGLISALLVHLMSSNSFKLYVQTVKQAIL